MKDSLTKRAPVVAVMGHIDHGKSTLLSYIRKSSKPLSEAGGITQHISAYEVEHKNEDGILNKITFLDTPGHEAFTGIRKRGAKVADIAVLVVSAEDGVKPQTVEALKVILESKIPYIVAISKIDKPDADIEKTKMSLAENEVYVEGFGGTIPVVPLSSKSGQGIDTLLDMIILSAELEELKGDPNKKAEGVIIESSINPQKGISATCIIKDGKMSLGEFIATQGATSPLRSIEDYLGQKIKDASFSSPVLITGWDNLPTVGETFKCFHTKDEAISYSLSKIKTNHKTDSLNAKNQIPVIIKADVGGSLEAVIYEIEKLKNENTALKVIHSGIGKITEGDIKNALGDINTLVIGFNTKVDGPADSLAKKSGIKIKTFDIIYKLSEWLIEQIKETENKNKPPEMLGIAKILKTFSKNKDKQIVGGTVEEGLIKVGNQVKVLRRDEEISLGKIRNLQTHKVETESVEANKEFGAMIECKVEIVSGDKIIVYGN